MTDDDIGAAGTGDLHKPLGFSLSSREQAPGKRSPNVPPSQPIVGAGEAPDAPSGPKKLGNASRARLPSSTSIPVPHAVMRGLRRVPCTEGLETSRQCNTTLRLQSSRVVDEVGHPSCARLKRPSLPASPCFREIGSAHCQLWRDPIPVARSRPSPPRTAPPSRQPPATTGRQPGPSATDHA